MPDSGRFRVALLIETSNRYGRDLLHGVHDWMSEVGNWSVRFTEQARLAPVPDWLPGWAGDGVIARVDTDRAARALRSTGLPVVDVSAERARSEFPRVTIDNVAVAHLAAAHLHGTGLVHFAFCGDRRFLWSRQRQRAFTARLRGWKRRCELFEFAADGAAAEPELARLDSWLLQLPKPVGIFVCYDGRAQQVLEACQRTGLQVPDSVAVLGVDNDEVLCDLSSPPLSSVLPNARRAGFEAARRLHAMMGGRRRPARESVAIEPLRVVARQSTDVVETGDPVVAAAVRHIRRHATDGLAVGELVRAVGLSRTHLERRFKHVLGQSPHELIQATRLEHVRQLLAESNLPIARIADLTGFQSPSYLSAVFRRVHDETPFEFRRRRRSHGAPGATPERHSGGG